jgi:predicted PurR-regulated permease PerM
MRWRRRILFPLLAALAVIAILAFVVFRPFFLTFAVAASVSLLLLPAQRRLAGVFGGRDSLAAALIVLVTTAIVLVPIVAAFILLAGQVGQTLDWVRPHLAPAEMERLWVRLGGSLSPEVAEWIRAHQVEASALSSQTLGLLVAAARDIVQGVLGGFTRALFELFLFLLMLFFLLRDGERIRAELGSISPFSQGQEKEIFDHLGRTVKGVLLAMVVVPIAQGAVASFGFLLFGIPSPIGWGVAVSLAAMVPILGSPLGWMPAVIWLFFNGSTFQWVGMLIFGVVAISGADNILKPLLLEGTAQIHPLLGFLSILGGVLAFGVFGFLIGPVILSLVISGIRIYRSDVLRSLAVEPVESEAE